MNTLFFDTETCGLPLKTHHYSEDFMEFPHIVQIAWMLLDENKNILIQGSHIIRPDGWEIPEEASNIHGITTEMAKDKGVDMMSVLRHFIIDCDLAEKIVAHNIYFDCSMVKANLLKLGIDKEIGNNSLDKSKRIDTMRNRDIINFVKAGNGSKWPKLCELYEKLFNKEMEGAHDAIKDIEALRDCYYELIKLNIIN